MADMYEVHRRSPLAVPVMLLNVTGSVVVTVARRSRLVRRCIRDSTAREGRSLPTTRFSSHVGLAGMVIGMVEEIVVMVMSYLSLSRNVFARVDAPPYEP